MFKLFLEFRAVFEFGAYFLSFPILSKAPRGDGHPVLVLPGFLAGDSSTLALRAFLKYKGYKPHGWGLGRNLGRDVNSRHGISSRLLKRAKQLSARYNRRVSLIGWSLGGIYARELSRAMRDDIRMVISMGSPFFYIDVKTNATPMYELLNGNHDRLNSALQQRLKTPPPVPSTAIFTRTDGIAPWEACHDHQHLLDEWTENVEIEGSHCGLGYNPLALWVIADRLAQPKGEWRPFNRSGFKKIVYRDPHRRGYFW
ncbi:MAG: alpha/beta hydrolase [Desulfobacteraceae bacterium]|nr:alpha/beta hydrolase [Desulfobacteraceae bacterium]MBC2755871.1 alpha/beta hydrolase [Desulfobacteraceae bacterium]MBC2763962.1 alpha/beta hydrolase [ANME-2 cluster archaeon]